MCRIAGMISKRLSPAEITEKVGLMCDSLKHGGPDDQGVFTDEQNGVAFGHRRLSIIDLSKNGHQPMADVQKKAWITFNGEIYNYAALKEQLLAAGAKFQSNSDTEVIIQAYLHWGTASFAKLKGMFAFGLFDIEKATTYLVRDTTGVKPLYYNIQHDQLSFASEIRAFKAAKITTEADPNWQLRFLAFGHIPEPYSTLKGVYSLAKSSFMEWNHQNGTYSIHAYYQKPVITNYITDLNSAKEYIHEGLKKSIISQLIADAPIGVFLSGGIDSSLITLLANEEKGKQLKTVSIFFNEKSYDERSFQNLIVNEISGEKFAHLVQQEDFETLLPDIIKDMDMPTTDGINTWFISKYAHDDGLKAVLSGVGADELYGGYPSFNRIGYLKHLRKIPSSLFKAAHYFKEDKYRKVSFLAHDHHLADYLLLRGLYIPADIAQILDMDTRQVEEVLFDDIVVPEPDNYSEEHAAWFESNFYMQNQLLRDTDVMSMAHGLEVRVPFLDEDFQRLAQSIAPAIRFDSKQPKKLLVDSFKDILPDATWNRPKMGFTFPLQEWMKQHAEIGDDNSYKNAASKKILKRFHNGEVHWSKVFALYQLLKNE